MKGLIKTIGIHNGDNIINQTQEIVLPQPIKINVRYDNPKNIRVKNIKTKTFIIFSIKFFI
jgi:hypothetical protein